ncbi:hypothetical protein IF2G_01537 [Cordyceps javanica]|nr:hypothetical protein IF2G_01537 [Cordyceps javanica]
MPHTEALFVQAEGSVRPRIYRTGPWTERKAVNIFDGHVLGCSSHPWVLRNMIVRTRQQSRVALHPCGLCSTLS